MKLKSESWNNAKPQGKEEIQKPQTEIHKMCSVASSLVFSFDSAGEIFASTTKGAVRLPEMVLVWRKGELRCWRDFLGTI